MQHWAALLGAQALSFMVTRVRWTPSSHRALGGPMCNTLEQTRQLTADRGMYALCHARISPPHFTALSATQYG